ncbi:TetR/AcrR family transcriptional regulator [Deinococcus sp. Arct2-2]|uniref:TetR/AcrR family transcriptional regulator n=1 Tax=Deinococcus sp. Arct2-2 TaxID=2568653 RepID=UPI0010A48286|nr:TetR/AcrR family transcriptional regulator [Deinococcus sp. Arct2-2]THF69732.1 TetR/AcrR family transcriptional regulator [Deinococcus sp. Arct2-2]
MRSKRTQIITAALRRFRTFGVCGTTLQDVAEASQVPLGNLYYYFKTRDDLVLAVLEECERELTLLLTRLAPLPPTAWLAGYFEWLLADPEVAVQLGCPFGALATELRALGHPAAPRAADIVHTYLRAVRTHAESLNLPAGTGDDVFLTVQGAYVVSRVSGDAALFRASIERLRIRTLGA